MRPSSRVLLHSYGRIFGLRALILGVEDSRGQWIAEQLVAMVLEIGDLLAGQRHRGLLLVLERLAFGITPSYWARVPASPMNASTRWRIERMFGCSRIVSHSSLVFLRTGDSSIEVSIFNCPKYTTTPAQKQTPAMGGARSVDSDDGSVGHKAVLRDNDDPVADEVERVVQVFGLAGGGDDAVIADSAFLSMIAVSIRRFRQSRCAAGPGCGRWATESWLS